MTGRLQSSTSKHRTFKDYLKRAVVARGITNHGECECGNPSRPGRGTCERCAFLDGDNNGTSMMISVLREQRYSTLADLVAATGMTPRAIVRVLAELKKRGRLASSVDELHRFKVGGPGFGNSATRPYWSWADVAIHFLVERSAS